MKNKYKNTPRRKTPWDAYAQLNPLEEFIKSNYLDSFYYKHPKLFETNETILLNTYVLKQCKLCNSHHIKKEDIHPMGFRDINA